VTTSVICTQGELLALLQKSGGGTGATADELLFPGSPIRPRSLWLKLADDELRRKQRLASGGNAVDGRNSLYSDARRCACGS